jgi:hypothetical protein
VIVTVYVPAATDEPTATVRVEESPAVTDVALNDAVGPEGETLTERLTVSAVPLVTVVLIVVVLLNQSDCYSVKNGHGIEDESGLDRSLK